MSARSSGSSALQGWCEVDENDFLGEVGVNV